MRGYRLNLRLFEGVNKWRAIASVVPEDEFWVGLCYVSVAAALGMVLVKLDQV